MKNTIFGLAGLLFLISLGVPFEAHSFILGSGGLASNPSGGGGPSFLTIGSLSHWLDTSDSLTYDVSNLVSKIADKSGNAWDFTQSTGAVKPTRVAAALNGRDVVAFDRTATQYLNGPGSIIVDRTAAYSIWFVLQQGTNGFYPTLWSFAGVSKAFILINDDNAAAGTRLDFGNNDFCLSFTAPGSSVWYTVLLTYNGGGETTAANYAAWVNGVSTSISQPHTLNNTQNVNLAGAFRTDNYTWDGKFAEEVVWSKALTSGDRTKLFNYSTAKWGL